MRISLNGEKLLEKEEGDILHVYKDKAKLPTIGIGHLLTRSELSSGEIIIKGVRYKIADGLTEQQSLDLLAQDVSTAESCVSIAIHVPLTQNQFDALVSLTFNIGTAGFINSSLRKNINAKATDQIETNFLMWDKITDPDTHAHVYCAELKERREREFALYNTK